MHQSNEIIEVKKAESLGFEILTLGHPALRQKSKEVSIEALKTSRLTQFINTLRNPLDRSMGVGVSAPQVGANLQIIIIKVTKSIANNYLFCGESPLKIYINPKYEIIGSEKLTGIESCLSVPGYLGKISRAKKLQVQALDENGQEFVDILSGWNARIFLHEYDHLNGILYIDHLLVDGKVFNDFYEKEMWKTIESEKRNSKNYKWLERHGLRHDGA